VVEVQIAYNTKRPVRRGRAALAWQKEITTPATRHVPLHLAENRIPAEIPWSL